MKTDRILIVDDDPKVRKILSDILSGGEYEPVMAATGMEAGDAVQGETPDIAVALIDLKLDDMSGLEVMREIKESSPDTECIILTGHASQETAIEAVNLGAYSYALKSYEMESLLLTIRRACDKRKAAVALRESEEIHRALASTADLMYLVDKDCRFLFMNEGYRARRGGALEDIIGKTYGELHPKEKAGSFASKVATIFETGEASQHESYSEDGKCFLRTLSPVKDQKDRIRAVTIVSKDITAHKKVEEALRESEERYRTILDEIKEGYFEVDLAGSFTFVNDALCNIFGYKRDEIIGMNNRVPTDSKTAKRAFSIFNEVYLTGKPANIKDYEVMSKDGSVGIREMHVSLMRDPEGNPTGFRGLSRDVTERRQAERALRENEERYRALFDNNPIETIIVDREAKVTGYNFAKKLSGDRLPNINHDVMYKDYAASHKTNMFEELRECIRSGILKEFLEQEYGDKFLDIKIAPFSEGAIITSIDVTNRKRAEEQRINLESQLQKAQKMKAIGTLAGGLAHDFNNLLMGIQGNASLILLDVDSSHPHYEKLRNIEQYVRDGADLTGQLLGFARGGKYEVKPTDLNKLVKKSSNMFGRTKKEIKIHKKYQQDIWMVEVDQGQIEQTLLNIYVNAWQAMPGGGEIYLQTENIPLDDNYVQPYNLEPGNYVKISITDTGTGIDAETAKRVFDPFFTTKEMGKGTGLGLASAYGIIKNHNGIIAVYSKEGIETTFNMYLPALVEAVSDQKHVVMKEELLMGDETILLVDDEELIIDVGGEILKFLGYTVFLARSGKEAIEIYKEKQDTIDLVMLDMIMPDMGGGKAYDILKKINPDIKVLLSSGYSINGQAQEIMEHGCDGFIQKPFSIEQISHKIKELLKK